MNSLLLKKLLVSLSVVVIITACNNDNKGVETAAKEFYYFPKTNLYYDVEAAQYIYSLDSARTWNIVDASNSTPPAVLGDKHVVHSNDKKVWQQNEEHREKFGGNIFNISAGAITVNTVTERKTANKAAPRKRVKQANEPKQEKGIKKFIKGIFGRKNKDEQR